MPNICKDCIHFRQETIEVPNTGGLTQPTYIDKKDPNLDPNDPNNLLLRIAQCSNAQTTNAIITRDSSTNWFFDTQQPYWAIVNGEIVVAGENDVCANFQAAP